MLFQTPNPPPPSPPDTGRAAEDEDPEFIAKATAVIEDAMRQLVIGIGIGKVDVCPLPGHLGEADVASDLKFALTLVK